jgi:DivIVA domain-containing protein
MAQRNISASDLRNAKFPTAKSGYEAEKVDAVLALCANTIEDLETQVAELQRAVALARAESAPMELATYGDDEDVIAQWLTTLDPLDIEREAQKNIAEAIVESTMAASHIRSEARERVKSLIDAVASEVAKLVNIVKDAKKSVAASNNLPNALSEWEGEFAGRINTLLQQLQLPWTVQVSQLAKVLSHMVEHADDESTMVPDHVKSKRSRGDREQGTSIKRSQTKKESAITTKGDWS